jgi:hypothetical protein
MLFAVCLTRREVSGFQPEGASLRFPDTADERRVALMGGVSIPTARDTTSICQIQFSLEW